MSASLVRFVARKVAGARRRVATGRARSETAGQFPELVKAYAAFGAASQISSTRQPFKGWDLWKLLSEAAPRSIAEMGSGTTSAVFALWARRHGAQYIAFEHHPEWARVTRNCLIEAGLCEPSAPPVRVVASRVRADEKAVGFVEPIPADADFVYIDGPPVRLPDGRKVPNDDITRLFETGARPRTIVIDGRIETVDAIRSHAVASLYSCELSFAYCDARGHFAEALSGREHTVFKLKSPRP